MTEGRTPRSRIYDGRFYARVLDPFLSGLHGKLAQFVEPGGRVLDVGCGTGDLAFRMAPRAEEVVGIELSPAMVEFANQRRSDEGFEHLSFVLGDVVNAFRERAAGYFDVATMVLALHEMPAEARTPVLREVTRVAKRLLCLDYRVPMPWNLAGARYRLVEAATGREHFGAFRDFCRRGGTAGIAETAGLLCEHVRHIDRQSLDISVIHGRADFRPDQEASNARSPAERPLLE